MEANRRIGLAPVPVDLDIHLSQAQLSALHKAEEFGWSIKFVRRATVVLVYEDGSTMGVLEADGTLNRNASVRERGKAGEDTPADDSSQKKFIV
jgi:hypothetical protein